MNTLTLAIRESHSVDEVLLSELENFWRTTFHLLMYKYGHYDQGTFEDSRYCQLPVKRSTDESLNDYCESYLTEARKLLQKTRLSAYIVRFSDKYETPILEFRFGIVDLIKPTSLTRSTSTGYRDYLRVHFEQVIAKLTSLAIHPTLDRRLKTEDHRAEILLKLKVPLENDKTVNQLEALTDKNYLIRPIEIECSQPEKSHKYQLTFSLHCTSIF
ncbi:unnamed protein product, partial [Mesorhabditis belari]|uniref:Uncharacterized protein n=1 Tax=Mesorhabditis belari TaxID=2138241 RepID=A0AAF3EFX5_9BILA